MSMYEFGPFRLDAERLLLLDGGEPVALGPKVVETLLALIEHPGDVLAKSALLDRIWPEGYVDEANLAQNVYVLRKLLRSRWRQDAIETIPRRGYRFTAEVRRLADVPLAQPTPVRVPQLRRRWPAFAAAALAVVFVAGIATMAMQPRPAIRPALSSTGARYYEIGRYYWNLRTPDGISKSLTYFARVIDADPRDARGYAALASANAIMGDYGFGASPSKVYFARARAYAKRALAIDPNCAEAYAVLGALASAKDMPSPAQLADGLKQLQHAIALDPSDAPAHEWYGIDLLALGRIDEAYRELRTSSDLDPLSVATMAWLGQAAYLHRDYDDAIAYSREALDLSPQRHEALVTLGLAYEARGEDARAISAFRRMSAACEDCAPEAAALLAGVYARDNRHSEAIAEIAIARAHPRDVEPSDLALALAAVGQRSVALSYLRRQRGYYISATIANDHVSPRCGTTRSSRNWRKSRPSFRRGGPLGVALRAAAARAHVGASHRRSRERHRAAPYEGTLRADGVVAQRLHELH